MFFVGVEVVALDFDLDKECTLLHTSCNGEASDSPQLQV